MGRRGKRRMRRAWPTKLDGRVLAPTTAVPVRIAADALAGRDSHTWLTINVISFLGEWPTGVNSVYSTTVLTQVRQTNEWSL
ncbi:hypothetical protein BDM02DRAFT_3107638 [Thelephora ganbajun]|uniref:Uncharacterized protein n=1 Tax=Thelephora ganbajun TaxID=370292 RepID=A0ACB6ZVU4_THEGA|nr:hypothetical protein BDM02DRAFT_3107638 [Thelephora ganbajun]